MKTLDRWLPTLALMILTGLITALVVARTVSSRITSGIPTWAFEDYTVELQPLLARYGSTRNSQLFEEQIIRDFFHDRRGGTFLDVGAYHYKNLSNTYYLETGLGWSGIAIDPQTEFAADYAAHRPRTRFVAMFASDVPEQHVQLFVTPDKTVASSTRAFTEREGAASATTVSVPTTTLNTVLEQAGVTRLDFMSMDIELHEPKALAGFDLERFRPQLVCIEGHYEVRQQILDYFRARNYTLLGKYLRADTKNLYFTPASQ